MCEQCLAATIGWRIFADDKGPILVRATRDGREMKTGQWGLVFMNGPFVIWDTTPIPDPGDPPDEYDVSLEFEDAEGTFLRDLHYFRGDFLMSPTEGHRLYLAAIEAGFVPEEDGFECWLFDRMGRAIQDRPNGDPDASTPDDQKTGPEKPKTRLKGQLGQ